MTRYGQFCPMAKAAEIVAERWTLLIIRELLAGSTRFNDLRRGVPLMSPALLSQRLQQLEQGGMIERQRVAARGTHEYRLTEAGRALAPVVRYLGEWGGRFVLDRLDAQDLDVTLLMWAMRRRVDPAAFGSRRVVVAFDFTDLPRAKRYWWLVNSGPDVDLCPRDPGFDVDLHVSTSLKVMTRIWVGALTLTVALRDGSVELDGARDLQQRFRSWLLLSPFASAGAGERLSPRGRRSAKVPDLTP
jgi:DNA-binding HxlR family transcriptional regulator